MSTSTVTKSHQSVSIADIQRTLGESTGSLYNLCRSTHINRLAKYRPLGVGKAWEPLDDIIRKAYCWGLASYWLHEPARNAPYGPCPECARMWGNSTALPGDSGAPCRLGDFENYDHEAIQTCWLIVSEQSQYGRNDGEDPREFEYEDNTRIDWHCIEPKHSADHGFYGRWGAWLRLRSGYSNASVRLDECTDVEGEFSTPGNPMINIGSMYLTVVIINNYLPAVTIIQGDRPIDTQRRYDDAGPNGVREAMPYWAVFVDWSRLAWGAMTDMADDFDFTILIGPMPKHPQANSSDGTDRYKAYDTADLTAPYYPMSVDIDGPYQPLNNGGPARENWQVFKINVSL